jgi:uncharacterized repeat protein (TIGR03803 family)
MRSKQFGLIVKKVLITLVLTFLALLTPGTALAGTEKILAVFHSPTGPQESRGTLVFDKSGNLYGTSEAGGATGHGTVFEVKHNGNGSWTTDVLYSFTGGDDGGNPYAGVIFDDSGNLFGTTPAGGSTNDAGVVFKLSPPSGESTTWTETVLHTFTGGDDGGNPNGGLIFDKSGNLYGTTVGVGFRGFGTVFRLAPPASGSGAWTETVIHTFGGPDDGAYPEDRLIFDGSGNLYGTASAGGTLGRGVVFELVAPSGGSTEWTENVLYNFTGDYDGRYPFGGVVFDKSGNLYGTTTSAREELFGSVFELSPNTDGAWTQTTLTDFICTQGTPYAGLTIDASGNLYGANAYAAQSRSGGIFELSPTSDGFVLSEPWQLIGWGKYSYAGVTLDAAGNLYSVSYTGSDNYGIVFEVIQ